MSRIPPGPPDVANRPLRQKGIHPMDNKLKPQPNELDKIDVKDFAVF